MVSPSVVLLDNHTTIWIGWKWETLGSNYQGYYAKYLKHNSYDSRLQPLFFLYGGRILDGSLITAGDYSNYWSSTSGTSIYAYLILFTLVDLYPSNNYTRLLGFSIRCLAR